ncbi:uncharacterized protein C11orf42 homolog [Anolis sagrei]|uniref:uncharacterized protein C11orf42 homolog n=1 Tax=Anolis sagrei TaxID=38937 RepID=UPI00351FFEE1
MDPSSGTQALEIGEADANWELIRDKVIEERFGPTVVPVPFLAEASCYDLLTVLVKRPPPRGPAALPLPLLLRHRRPRCLVPVGPLEGLLRGGPAPAPALCHGTREYSARVRGESRYEETRLVAGTLRHIRLTMSGVHKKVAFLALRPGTLALRTDLPWLRAQRSLFVIYEVFYCGRLCLAVTQGQSHRSFLLERPLPVAFSCLKFALGPKGVLGPQKPVGHILPARAAWVHAAVLEAPKALNADPTTDPAKASLPGTEGPLTKEKAVVAGRKRWRSLRRPLRPLAGKWPFRQPRPRLGPTTGSLSDPERHSMSLPLLHSAAGEESDPED